MNEKLRLSSEKRAFYCILCTYTQRTRFRLVQKWNILLRTECVSAVLYVPPLFTSFRNENWWNTKIMIVLHSNKNENFTEKNTSISNCFYLELIGIFFPSFGQNIEKRTKIVLLSVFSCSSTSEYFMKWIHSENREQWVEPQREQPKFREFHK